MKKGWTEVALGEVLEQVDRIEPVRPDGKYRLLGVRLEGRGAFHRETKLGTETSASLLNRVKEGDFIYSRLYAWKGAFALIEKSLDGCFVSNEFPVFRPVRLEQISLRYLRYWFNLPKVWKAVEEDCQGSTPTTRNRFNERFFLKLKIPLPPLVEQERIVARLDAIEQRLNRIRKLREEAEKELLAALRSTFHKIEADAEWIEMGEVAPMERRQIEIEEVGEYPELGARSFGKGIFHKPTLIGSQLTWQKLFEIRAGDIVFSNIKAWEGAIAVASDEDHARFASHRYLTCVADRTRALPEFICFYLLTSEGLEKIGKASPGSADRNRTLAVKRLEKITVPVPSMHKQQEFLKLLTLRRNISNQHRSVIERENALLPSLLDRVFNR